MDIPVLSMSEVPYATTEQMIEVDRAMMEDYQIQLKVGAIFSQSDIIRLSHEDENASNRAE